MSAQKYLLEFSIGPVQDFIKAARRTRDLWFGSMMLSEISKAVALAVCDSKCAKLIFPSADAAQLQPADDNPNNSLNVANVILAEVEGTDEVLANIDESAREAAQNRLMSYANPVLEKLKNWIDETRWNAQLEDILEFYCAWVPLDGEYSEYSKARKEVGRLLAMRKNIRNFKPNRCDRECDKVPKSALDGLRESVFNRAVTEKTVYELRNIVRLKKGEALDAIGLIKRMGIMSADPKDQSFPSISRVAVDPWVRGRGSAFLKGNGKLECLCHELVSAGVLSKVSSDVYSAFPYEGTVLFPSRHAAMLEEYRGDPKELERLEEECRKLTEGLDSPQEPYVACLCADGDRMGATLSAMETAVQHREFSKTLAQFAGNARDIIKDHHGVCIYTGGDDVLAFLPLDTALKCARALHDKFHELMGRFGNPSPTLSVGLSIAHAMEDLELHLEYGRKAESAAKKGVDGKAEERDEDRNGLAVSVRARGNSATTVREQWKGGSEDGPLEEMSLALRLDWWAEQFKNDRIPQKFPYELHENTKFYYGWAEETDSEKDTLKNAAQSDVKRIFDRKDVNLNKDVNLDSNGKARTLNDLKARIREYITTKVSDAKTIRELSDEMIVAQWIAIGKRLAEPGQRNETTTERTVNNDAVQDNTD